MLERKDLFVTSVTLESGKPVAEARAEFDLSAEFLLWFCEQVSHLSGSYTHASHGGFRIVTTLQPIGPSLLITPWNFPLLMVVRKAGAALGAGCTVVIKPASETPLTAALFVQTLQDAGIPAGVINLVHTTRAAELSTTLIQDQRLRKVSFTGSSRVGSELLRLTSVNITSSSLELGGDGPFIVLEDADIDLAVDQAIICKFRNAGQACVAANRIIVNRQVEAEFTEKFLERTRMLKVGDGFVGVDVGPMISLKQRNRLKEMMEELIAAGGTVLIGGHALPGPGYFYEPTVVRFQGPNAVMCGNELFAPVATIFPVDSIAEAVEFANDTKFGLASYLFTRDLSRAIDISERLEFGMVGVNRGIMADPAAPFGGIKASGTGREGGHRGIHEFLEEKYIAMTISRY